MELMAWNWPRSEGILPGGSGKVNAILAASLRSPYIRYSTMSVCGFWGEIANPEIVQPPFNLRSRSHPMPVALVPACQPPRPRVALWAKCGASKGQLSVPPKVKLKADEGGEQQKINGKENTQQSFSLCGSLLHQRLQCEEP